MTQGASAGRLLAGGLAASVAALLVFGWLAERVATGTTIAMDGAVRSFLHQHSSPGLTALMRFASGIGETVPLLILSAAAFVFLLIAYSGRPAAFFALTMGGSFVLDTTLKLAFHRPRPAPFFGTPEPQTYSFPSGHAIFAACYFGILAAFVTARIRSRWARGAIWFAAGTITGLVWVTAAAHADRLLRRRQRQD
jgi:undecaprenyl-diphosphatase